MKKFIGLSTRFFEHFYHFNPLTYTILINKNYKCPKTNIDLKSFSHFFHFNNLFFLFKLMFIKFNKSFYLKNLCL